MRASAESAEVAWQEKCSLGTEELEARMRPGEFAQSGFLALNESLEEVISRDAQSLQTMGVAYESIAEKLEELFVTPITQMDYSEEEHVWKYKVGNFEISLATTLGSQGCPFTESEGIRRFGGGGECSHSTKPYAYHAGSDFKVLNLGTGEAIVCPGLITHLIRDHHFFEGSVSYRVDPELVCRVLGLTA
jgi:hypothetical protein